MAERLTEHNKTGWVLKLDDPQNEFEARQQLMSKFKLACEKLGKLEDILEKYGVDVEKLNQMLEWLFALSGQDADDMKFIARDRKLIHQQYCDIKTDRDTWKRACELACQIIISGYCDSMEDTTDWEDAVYQWKEDNSIETYGIGVEELLEYLLEQAKKEGEQK